MINKKDFKIRFDLIVKYDISKTANWTTNSAVLAMVDEIPMESMYELFKEVIASESYVESQMPMLRNWLTLLESKNIEKKAASLKEIRNFLSGNWGFGAGNNPNNFYYIFPYKNFGVNLNQPIEVKPEHKSFPLLFSFRFSKTEYPIEFLEFHFVETFNRSRDSFRLLLTRLDKSMISERIELINEWRDQNLKKQSPSKQGIKRIKKVETLDFYFGNKKDKAKSLIVEFLFDESGEIKGKGKGHRIRQLAGALYLFIESQSKKYNASKLAQVLYNEFGDKLRNEISTLRDYTKKDKLIENEASKRLSKDLISVLN